MDYFISVGVFTAITTLGVLGTFVLTGLTGLFSLGQAAFMGLGAYVAAVAVVKYSVPFPLAVAMAVLLSVAVAYVIGYATLKIRQDFFALVTFGFGEALRAIMDESVKYTGGAMGFSGVPQLTTPWLAVGSLAVAVWLIRNVRNSKFGRDCLAIRTDELAAQVIGIDAFGHKLKVFLLGAGLSSFGPTVYTVGDTGMTGTGQAAQKFMKESGGGTTLITRARNGGAVVRVA